jgi:CRP-like cAMP-binding protein
VLAGKMIFSEGDQGGSMYVVASGEVELFLEDLAGERIVLRFVQSGQFFGELSPLDNEPRSASAKAVENTRLLIISQEHLYRLIESHPAAAIHLMQILTQRLRSTTSLMQERTIRNANVEVAIAMTFGERLSDFMVRLVSNIYFIALSVVIFSAWVIVNLGLVSGLLPFDPKPFGLLSTTVAVEAIFLTLCVLLTQKAQAQREKVRNDVEYEVNLRAGADVRALSRQVDNLQELIMTHLTTLNASNGRRSEQ